MKNIFTDAMIVGAVLSFSADNSPDSCARQLKTFPRHKHVWQDKIVESNILIDLSAVLEAIGVYTESEE